MAAIFDADTYLQSLGCSGLTVRMKLLYDANRLSVRLQRALCFDARCEGWKNGPVYPALWHHPDNYGDPSNLTDAQKAILNFVFTKLGRASGKQLSKRSHDFPEWIKSREGLSAIDVSNGGDYFRRYYGSFVPRTAHRRRRHCVLSKLLGIYCQKYGEPFERTRVFSKDSQASASGVNR